MSFIDKAFDYATNPQVAVPTVTTGAGINMIIDHLPIFINCGMAIYVVLLVAHKAWNFLNEYKDRKNGASKQ